MKHLFSLIRFIFIGAGLFLLFTVFPALADNNKKLITSNTTDVIIFKAPKKDGEILRRNSKGSSRSFSRNQITRRKGNLTRGIIRKLNRDNEKDLSVPAFMIPLSPESTGLTSNPQPALFWYVSGPCPDKIEFRLNAFRVEEPILDTHIDGPSLEGIYRINLADYNVKLEPDVLYEWLLTIVFDEQDRSGDYYISAAMRFVKPLPDLSLRVENISADQKYVIYGHTGYWYDALYHISQLIDSQPDRKEVRMLRANLFKQVNLPRVADYDIRQISEE